MSDKNNELAMSKIHQIMAARMTDSWTQSPQFNLTMDIDIDPALTVKKHLNKKGIAASLTDLILYSIAKTLISHPKINAYWQEGTIKANQDINIGLAVAIRDKDDLVVAVVKNADKKDIKEIVAETTEIKNKAKRGEFALADISGSTFTISNLGMFGIDNFTAIINPPESGIMAVGQGVKKPVIVDGTLAQKTIASFTLTLDHRVSTGVTGARFFKDFKECIEGLNKNKFEL